MRVACSNYSVLGLQSLPLFLLREVHIVDFLLSLHLNLSSSVWLTAKCDSVCHFFTVLVDGWIWARPEWNHWRVLRWRNIDHEWISKETCLDVCKRPDGWHHLPMLQLSVWQISRTTAAFICRQWLLLWSSHSRRLGTQQKMADRSSTVGRTLQFREPVLLAANWCALLHKVTWNKHDWKPWSSTLCRWTFQ